MITANRRRIRKTSRRDPTRTTLLRRKFLSDINRRVKWLQKEINKKIVDEDVFALIPPPNPLLTLLQGEFAFLSNPQKMQAFMDWLQGKIDAGLLTVGGKGIAGQPWTYEYVRSGYTQGLINAYQAAHPSVKTKLPLFQAGSREAFLFLAFSQPIVMDKLKLLGMRSFEQLKGISAAMSQQISIALMNGLVGGLSPYQIARNINRTVVGISKNRAKRIARTEIIYAHAEGQLDAFELMGVKELGLFAEWSTVGDKYVCVQCLPYEGVVFTVEEARGMIPLHPNCFINPKTKIITNKGYKNICDIKVNDMVLTHKLRYKPVTSLIRTLNQMPNIVKIYTDKSTLCLTENHPIKVGDMWLKAKEVIPGMGLFFVDTKLFLHRASVLRTENKLSYKKHTLYNFSVEEDESYTANGYMVHNCRCSWIPYWKGMEKYLK